MKYTHCVICGKKEKQKILFPSTLSVNNITDKTFSARRMPDRMHHQFVTCERCGLIFSSPILDPKDIQKFYRKSTFTYAEESDYLKMTYGRYLQKLLNLPNTTAEKLLDIGCGNGFFLEEARARGVISVAGVEPGVKSVEKARNDIRKNIKIDTFKKGLFKKNSFNIITCFHTLDHIIDPNSFLTEAKNILKKDGKALFIVHNTNGLSVILFGEKSPIFDIEHVYLFNKKNLREIFEKNGLRVITVFDVLNTYPLIYWFRMTPMPKKLKNVLLFVMKKLKIEHFPFTFGAGNIGIIAEKP